MSGKAVGWAKSRMARNTTAKAVLICLADYADADGIAWPNVASLAKEVQASARTVQRALRSLEEDGLISVEERYRKDRGQTSNGYRLMADIVAPPLTDCHPPHDTSVTPPVTTVSPPYELPIEQELSDESSPAREKKYPDAFEIAWKAYPHVKGRSSKSKTLSAWHRVPPAARLALPLASAAYARDGREPKGEFGAPAMERWLAAGRYEDWLTSGPTEPTGPVDPWPSRERNFALNRYWNSEWGPNPDQQAYRQTRAA